MPWKYAVAICCGNLPQLFAVGLFCVCKQIFFLCDLIFFLCKQTFSNWKQTLFIWEQNFWFMRISFLTVFHFVFVVAVMGHRSSQRLFSLQIKLFLCQQSNLKNWMLLQSLKKKQFRKKQKNWKDYFQPYKNMAKSFVLQ